MQTKKEKTPHPVALRKESVDRNISLHFINCMTHMSLSARRAWIEIWMVLTVSPPQAVALRKESVDRNGYPGKQLAAGQSRSPQGERG